MLTSKRLFLRVGIYRPVMTFGWLDACSFAVHRSFLASSQIANIEEHWTGGKPIIWYCWPHLLKGLGIKEQTRLLHCKVQQRTLTLHFTSKMLVVILLLTPDKTTTDG